MLRLKGCSVRQVIRRQYSGAFPQNLKTLLNPDASNLELYYEDMRCKNTEITVMKMNRLIWKIVDLNKPQTNFAKITTEFSLSNYDEYYGKFILDNRTNINVMRCFPDMHYITDYFREQGFDSVYEQHGNMNEFDKEKHIMIRKFKLNVNYNKQRNPKWMLDMTERRFFMPFSVIPIMA